MLSANVAELKTHLSDYLKKIMQGEVLTICMRNTPVASIQAIPSNTRKKNQTVLGIGKNTVTILTDLTAPILEESEWEMLKS